MAYERLESQHVLTTVERLEGRVAARFPERHLVLVANELEEMVRQTADVGEQIRKRLAWTRVASRMLIALVVLLALAVFAWGLGSAATDDSLSGEDWLPLVESTVNDIIFASLAVYFLYSFPERLLRSHTLHLLHRLRSLAHIIDMHQLAKDPERLRTNFSPTRASITADLDPEQLVHYLEYCSELLALVGKAAALCAEDSSDSVVLDTVSNVESLTVDLSRKIWQKISVVNEIR